MTAPTARAIASVAAAGACGAIGWHVPDFAIIAILGIIVSMRLIWWDA